MGSVILGLYYLYYLCWDVGPFFFDILEVQAPIPNKQQRTSLRGPCLAGGGGYGWGLVLGSIPETAELKRISNGKGGSRRTVVRGRFMPLGSEVPKHGGTQGFYL